MTTRDVIASLKRWMVRDTIGGKLGEYTAGMEAVDDKTFVLRAEAADGAGAVRARLGGRANPSDHARERCARPIPMKPITETIGSGPFRFNRDEWRSGARVVYDRNTDYVPRNEPADGLAGGRVVKVDRVEWLIMPDARRRPPRCRPARSTSGNSRART